MRWVKHLADAVVDSSIRDAVNTNTSKPMIGPNATPAGPLVTAARKAAFT